METENIDVDESLGMNQKESIKLIKNSRGYGFEIKLLRDKLETMDQFMQRLKEANTRMVAEYGAVYNDIKG